MKMYDYDCPACGTFEELVANSEVSEVECKCGLVAPRVPSAPRLGIYNDPNVRKEALLTRSREHSMKELKKEPERAGFIAAEAPKLWNKRSPSK